MGKVAQSIPSDSTGTSQSVKEIDTQLVFLKQKKEQEIRSQLSDFARELAQAKELKKTVEEH